MKYALEHNHALEGTVIRDDFWSPKLKTFFEVTLIDSFDKFEKDGTLDNFRDVIEGKHGTHRACPWHDGLLYEMIRGASDYLARGEKNDALQTRIDGYIDLIARAQDAAGGGYIHTLVLLEYPSFRYGDNGGNILWQHDLYNHGGLFEAGVHYYKATGKTKLLEVAVKAANALAAEIGEPPKKFVVPGHPLPEYALMELYELVTDEPELRNKLNCPVYPEAYRELARFWIFGRGHHEARTNNPQYMGEYAQDHAPIHLQTQASGHAVRATLYYTGVTREAMLDGDEQLLQDSLRLWNNVTQRKLHISGGVGATHFEEKFGFDYDLVNTAYLETCASAGLILWAESLSRATGSAAFFQTIEKALYNLMLSSVTLQGDGYFYRNPLQSDGSDHHWAWNTCPCCPPMIHKIFGMMDRLIYAADGEGLLVNLLIGSQAEMEFDGGRARIKAETALPWKGEWQLTVEKADRPILVRVRIPEWACNPQWQLNGKKVLPGIIRGYAVFPMREGDTVTLTDPLYITRVEAHPYVGADKGRVSLTRGPLVYCLEGVDNHGETDIELAEDPHLTNEYRKDLLGGVTVLHGKQADGTSFTAVPLYTWDNRSSGQMNVWLKQRGKSQNMDVTGWKGKLYRPYVPKTRR